MSVLSLARVAAIRADPARRTRLLADIQPDRSRPFLPEEQTQLYHTPAYENLSHAQRLRYNQLFGLRVNEYIMMLERNFVEPVLATLKEKLRESGERALVEAIDAMREEEALHYQAFAHLNRSCEPAAYRHSDCWLMQLRPHERAMLHLMRAGARWLPFALWIIVAVEEFSIAIATAMMRSPVTALGSLDAAFVAVHREHAKDEARHIHVDVHLVRSCLQSLPPAWRRVNARLFMAFMRDMTAPRASGTGARVVKRLVTEFPELAPRQDEMIAALVALRDDLPFQCSLFNRQITPLAFGLYDEEPALAGLGTVLKGYARR